MAGPGSGAAKKIRGQTTLEYFILFSIIVILTLMSFNTFIPKLKKTLQGDSRTGGVFQSAIGQRGLNVENR